MPVPLAHQCHVAEWLRFVNNPVQIVLSMAEYRYQYFQIDYSELYYYCSCDTTDADDVEGSWAGCPRGKVFEHQGLD
jgi:hypothetical protein